MAMLQGNVNYGTNFSPYVALFWVVIVVTIGSRTVQGAAIAAASFTLLDAVILKGAIFAWILGGNDKIPGFMPISPKWLLVLFGLGAIQYAKHPEGVLEMTQRRSAARRAKRADRRSAAAGSDPGPGPHPPPSSGPAVLTEEGVVA
jgi:hypothetical protein